MLSVCIPVFNFDISSLVGELAKQADLLRINYEIIVIDDCSHTFRDVNKVACSRFKYIELESNIGRSKIRNLFLEFARYEYFLFLDCDSLIVTPDFISKYTACIHQSLDVVCGGRVYDSQKPSRDKLLRWKYGILRESKSAETRSKQPSRSFMTNNFLVRKSILTTVRFDERLTQYGHEDTLFGFALKENNISVTHIHNPVLNGDIETNSEFMNKTRAGIENLHKLVLITGNHSGLINDVTLLRLNHKIKAIEPMIYLLYKLLKPILVFTLTNGFINLTAFAFFKLGYLIESRTKIAL